MMLYVQRLCTLAVIIIANGEKKRRNYSWRLNNIHLSIGTISNEKCAKELWIDVTKCHLFPCGIQHRQAFTPLFVPLFRHEPQCLSHTNDNLLFRQPCRRSIQAEIFLSLFYQFFFHDAPCWQFISNWTLFWHTTFYIHHSLDGKFDNEIAKDSLFQCYQLRIHRTRTTLLIIEWHADKPKHSSSFRGFAMNVNIHDIGKQYVP